MCSATKTCHTLALVFDVREADMTITVTDPDTALDALARHLDQLERAVLDVPTARVRVPRVGGLAGLSTDVFGDEKMSHPRTSVRGEGRRT